MPKNYIALIIGNSRLHWAWFVDNILQQAWDTNHLPREQVEQKRRNGEVDVDLLLRIPFIPSELASINSSDTPLPLYIASVVPHQTQLWQIYPTATVLTLADIPLSGVYPTLGIDRALALLGAGETYGYPVLVIDAGTALTFTGANSDRHLVGGAILPGLGLQLQSLAQKTAALPATPLPSHLPSRWAMQTSTAIESGVIYTILAGIRDFITDWRCQFPDTQIVLTGGDSQLLLSYLQSQYPETACQIIINPHLVFLGMSLVRPIASLNDL